MKTWEAMLLGAALTLGGVCLLRLIDDAQPKYQLQTVSTPTAIAAFCINTETGDMYRWYGNDLWVATPSQALKLPAK